MNFFNDTATTERNAPAVAMATSITITTNMVKNALVVATTTNITIITNTVKNALAVVTATNIIIIMLMMYSPVGVGKLSAPIHRRKSKIFLVNLTVFLTELFSVQKVLLRVQTDGFTSIMFPVRLM